MMITHRKAQASDRDDLYRLLRRSWLENWAPHVRAASVRRFHAEDPVRHYLDQCLAEMDIAVLDGELAGMMHLEDAFLHAIHVSSDMQGRGVGSALMDEAERRGARRLEVRAFNERARTFYRGRGWRETRRYSDAEMGTLLETIEMVLPGHGDRAA